MFRCPEALFKPTMIGKEMSGFPELVYESIQRCDIDIRRPLYDNIVLSGGTTLFPGIQKRLTNELEVKVKNIKSRVVALSERKYLVWMGGAILAGLSTFQNQWITKQEYQETGSYIVHRKCF